LKSKSKHDFYTVILTLSLALLGLILVGGCSSPESRSEAKAAIIDQLYPLEPNQAFIDKATEILESSGFKVEIYRGDDITVDFYRNLPALGYKLIIFRSHSGIQSGTIHLSSGDKPVVRTYLFTNEPYDLTAHIGDQLSGLSDRLAKVRIDDNHPWEFGISPDFVSQSMHGNFDHTVVIMMGCYTSYVDDLAQSFIEKGASAYAGWDAFVGLDYVDNATMTLLESLFSNKVSLDAAERDTMQEKGADPIWGAKLKYYPPQSGNHTIAELTMTLGSDFKDKAKAP
jgi:hypothetical protein